MLADVLAFFCFAHIGSGPTGYLSVVDWPLLPFYGCMCAAYVVMGIVWLILCARYEGAFIMIFSTFS